MSFPHECPACYRGNHDRHDRGHGLTPGLIGGSYCPCTGDCATKQRRNPLDLLDGYCSCPPVANGHTAFARDCGIAAHRVAAPGGEGA